MALTKEKTNFNMLLNIPVKRFALTFLIIFISGTISFAQDAAAGEALFKQNCTQCHAVNDVVVGPALKGVSKRRKIDWIVNFVHNSQKVIKGGDAYAVELYNKFNKTEMPAFPQLSDDDIKNIVAYIGEEEKKGGAEAKTTAGTTGTATTGTTTTPPSEGGDYSTIILGLVVVVLVLVLLMLVVFLNIIKKYLSDREATLPEDDKYLVNQKFDIKKALTSKEFIIIVSLLFVGVGVRSCWVGLLSIGVEQNYAPVQPIPFSHKLHAGDNQIDCGYCHTGVYRGKNAGIPAVNICMNCHSGIKSGPQHGTKAIAKVIEAWETKKPIKWVRIHNLPDLAYFNHSQHTVVGGVKCETCHGPIAEMEVVKQFSPLTMGWCINCHRETAVNGKDNAYYDKLMAAHNGKKLTVEEIGGLECSKCHY
jgi:mono/diheme cytochrome c family protein